jgi:integrase/recombinase XerD
LNFPLIEEFADYLTVEKRVSLATVELYTKEASRYLTFLARQKISLNEADFKTVTDYLILRKTKNNLSSRTEAKNISALNSFYLFLQENESVTINPLSLIDLPKLPTKIPQSVSYNAIEEILSVIDTSDVLGLRDYALFGLIYSCGLRVSEAITINLSDYSSSEKSLRIVGKGDKERIVPVGQLAIKAIDIYLKLSRPTLVNDKLKSNTLFLGRRGEPLNRASVWKRFKEYAKLANVDAKVHTLRHSYASHLLRGGADLRSVQELLGHSDIRTTQIYTHTDTEDLLQIFRATHPKGEKDKK